MDSSRFFATPVDNGCSTLTPICVDLLEPLLSSMGASAVPSNATTLPAKSNASGKPTRKPKSSKTSAADSTSSAKGCVPYWNDFCAATSSELWCPTVTDLHGSESMLSSSLSNTTVENSWFSTQQWKPAAKLNSLPIYSPSSSISLAACTGSEVTKAKRVRIDPTPEQKTLFRQWLGTSRYVYNETVKHLNLPKGERAAHWMGAAKIILPSLPEWAAAIPYQIKKIAIEDAYQAFSNGMRQWRQSGEPFRLNFRSRRTPKQSCFIPSSALKDAGIYPRIAGNLQRAEDFPDHPRDSRLICEQGRWFVIVPSRSPVTQTENQGRVVALDPGIRIFLTGFSEDQAFKLGEGDFARLARLCVHLDRLISRLSKATCRQKARIKQAVQRMRWKIRDLVDELHFKSIRFLMDRFDLILLPTFETKEMSAKSKRKIRAKSVRAMLGYAFFRFGQRLESAAKQAGKAVLRVNEAYTSKTASWTGEMKPIGGAKKITSGGLTVDRDINGARGIFLRALVDTPSLRNECAYVAN